MPEHKPELKTTPTTPNDLIASVISTDPGTTIEYVWGDPDFNMAQYKSWLGITHSGAAPYCIGVWNTKHGAIRVYVNPDVECRRVNINYRAAAFLEVYCDGQFDPQFNLYGPVVVTRRTNKPNPDTEPIQVRYVNDIVELTRVGARWVMAADHLKDKHQPLDIPEIDI